MQYRHVEKIEGNGELPSRRKGGILIRGKAFVMRNKKGSNPVTATENKQHL
jgi:hypothetical protein